MSSLDAVLVQGAADVGHDGGGQLSVPPGDHIVLGGAADDVLRGVVHDGVQPALRVGDGGVQGLGEFLRVCDVPQDVAVTDHSLLVAGDDIRGGQVVEQDFLGQGVHALDEGNLEADASLRYHMVDFSELAHQAILIFPGDDDAGRTSYQQYEQYYD